MDCDRSEECRCRCRCRWHIACGVTMLCAIAANFCDVQQGRRTFLSLKPNWCIRFSVTYDFFLSSYPKITKLCTNIKSRMLFLVVKTVRRYQFILRGLSRRTFSQLSRQYIVIHLEISLCCELALFAIFCVPFYLSFTFPDTSLV